MATFDIIEASGKAYCRGGEPNCITNRSHRGNRGKIPQGTKSLVISIYGAGGGETAFYCCNCMVPILEKMRDLLDKA